MPSVKKNNKLSVKRKGKSVEDIHNWINDEKENVKRHNILEITNNLKIVKEKFGEKGAKEFLYHIRDDYEQNQIYLFIKFLSKIKRVLFTPFRILNGKI